MNQMPPEFETQMLLDDDICENLTEFALHWRGGMYALGNYGAIEFLVSRRPSQRITAIQFSRMQVEEFEALIPFSLAWRGVVLQGTKSGVYYNTVWNDIRISWTRIADLLQDFIAINVPLCILNQDWIYDEHGVALNAGLAMLEINSFRENPSAYDEVELLDKYAACQ